MSDPVFPKVFTLQGFNGVAVSYVVITPQATEPKIVTAAWTHAVRYTAKGIDLPDHDAAIKLMLQRHPSWKVITSTVHAIAIDLKRAEEDIPENQ